MDNNQPIIDAVQEKTEVHTSKWYEKVISNYKLLPNKTKRLLSFGVLVLLILALPLIVISLTSTRTNFFNRAATGETIEPPYTPIPTAYPNPTKISKVLVIEFNPMLSNNELLSTDRGWNTPINLEQRYINELNRLSSGYVGYQITKRITVNDFTLLDDGYKYNEETYLKCLNDNSTCHQPDVVNYTKILNDYKVCEQINSGEIDELWLWGGPWFGYKEAIMAGPNAFYINGMPLTNTSCTRDFNIMGFNYERDLSEMIEDFGHRFEGTMLHVFNDNGSQLWTNYTKFNLTNPEQAACGTVHYPPNGTKDYDWSNTTVVTNTCEDWLNYPNLTGASQTFGCERWGCTGLGWKEYWLSHIPHASTFTNGGWDNWWKYVIDYDEAISMPTIRPTPTSTAKPTPVVTSTPTPTPTATPTQKPIITPTSTPTSVPTVKPVISTTFLPWARLRSRYSANISGYENVLNTKLSMTISGLPSGLSYSCSSGQTPKGTFQEVDCKVTGTPKSWGLYKIHAKLTDNRNQTVSKTIGLIILPF